MPAIIKTSPDVVFLVIGKTHPEVVKTEGEKYRNMLESMVIRYKLTRHVKFINSYLPLPELLEYLQLTDVYLFTTNDPNQVVSGTFAYAMGCACPIISTPNPHAREVLTEDTGIIFDFRNSQQLAEGVIRLLNDEPLRKNISSNTLQKIVSTAWENSAIAHAMLVEKIAGDFLNYVDKDNNFTDQNKATNLNDANGRAVWALGYLVSLTGLLPGDIISEAETIIQKPLLHIGTVHSTRAMAFAIKGLYYYHSTIKLPENFSLIKTLAKRLVQMYKHESNEKWEWFEGYLTYANSILPEAMLYAWLLTGETIYKDIAISSFRFLLSQTFNENGIEVISNKNWLQKGQEAGHFGEQPIDVAYTIMTLSKFCDVFMDEDYRLKMQTAFTWFLGNNRLHKIIYNPCTGGCYDGLEETHVNLNQGAESTVSYLMARLTVENNKKPDRTPRG